MSGFRFCHVAGASTANRFQRIIRDATRPGDLRQAGRFEINSGDFVARKKPPLGHDSFGVLPVICKGAPEQGATKEHLDLMKAAAGVMEFVDQAGWPDADIQACFLMHLAPKVVGQGRSRLDPAARRTPQGSRRVRPRIDQQQAVFVQKDGANGQSGGQNAFS